MSQNTGYRFVLSLFVLVFAVVSIAAPAVRAQQERQTFSLDLPDTSPAAAVHQTVGVTDLTVAYHRPGVKDREVFGSLVPYGQVWRTGADENTLFTTSTAIRVEGQDLPAGAYGLHTIPGEDEWTIIFSNDTTAWGSFSYDEANDALRVKVTPTEAPEQQEWMLFSFPEADNESATLALTWDDVRVPIRIEVDPHAHALASIRDQLKGAARFGWRGPYQAANYCVQNDLQCEEAMDWVDASIQNEERFENLALKSTLLDTAGEAEEAAELLEKALPQGNANQLFGFGVGLINQDKPEKALMIFQKNVELNPDTWFVEYGVARALSALGRFDEAVEKAKAAVEKAPNPQAKTFIETQIQRLEKGEDIN